MSRINELFSYKLANVNIGATRFKDELATHGTQAVQLGWQPPAGGCQQLIKALQGLAEY